jgi:glutaredoxin 3
MTKEFTIYSKPACTQCDIAKNLLKTKGISYKEIELDVGQPKVPGKIYENVGAFKAANPDAKTAPQIFVDGKRIGGLNELRQMLQ